MTRGGSVAHGAWQISSRSSKDTRCGTPKLQMSGCKSCRTELDIASGFLFLTACRQRHLPQQVSGRLGYTKEQSLLRDRRRRRPCGFVLTDSMFRQDTRTAAVGENRHRRNPLEGRRETGNSRVLPHLLSTTLWSAMNRDPTKTNRPETLT